MQVIILMAYKVINNFNEIEIIKDKTLIICDIDKTILYHDVKKEKFIDMLKDDNFDEKEQLEIAQEMMDMYCRIYPPQHTDPEGFKNLSDKINKLNGKIVFLTARSYISEAFTKENFKQIGLNYEEYDCHYTDNKISKGDYIKANIELSFWNDIIFIDDYDFNLISVWKNFPHLKCYKFVVNLS